MWSRRGWKSSQPTAVPQRLVWWCHTSCSVKHAVLQRKRHGEGKARHTKWHLSLELSMRPDLYSMVLEGQGNDGNIYLSSLNGAPWSLHPTSVKHMPKFLHVRGRYTVNTASTVSLKMGHRCLRLWTVKVQVLGEELLMYLWWNSLTAESTCSSGQRHSIKHKEIAITDHFSL